jgi:hypothetical protein
MSLEQRRAVMEQAARQRDVEIAEGQVQYVSGALERLTAESTPTDQECQRVLPDRTRCSPDTTTRPTLATNLNSWIFYPFSMVISSAAV